MLKILSQTSNMKSAYLIQDTILRVYSTSPDAIIINDIDITTFLPNNTQAYSIKKPNDQFGYLFNKIIISNINDSSDCLNDRSCFIMALYYIKVPIFENDTLSINLINKYSYNVIEKLWDPMEDIDPIYYSQIINKISKCFFIIIYLKTHQESF